MAKSKNHSNDSVNRLTAWVGSVPSLIVHTLVFMGAFSIGVFNIAPWELVLLILTTAVSLEAIYLAIFIQMTVNQARETIEEVEEDIEHIEEDIQGIEKDIDSIEENIEELGDDMEEIGDDIEEIQEDIEELGDEPAPKSETPVSLDAIAQTLHELVAQVEALKRK
jgi:uncharacterized protein YoxC